MRTKAWTQILALAVMVLSFCGCTTVSETGRKQLSFVSPAEETKLGLSAWQEVKQQTPISKDAAGNAMVQRVGRRIASVVTNMPDAQWEFVLFEDKTPNAFCLPGGKVGVNTGILPLTKDDAGLATVIGHEVAHAALHHGAERVSEATLLQAGSQILGALTGASKYSQAIALAYGAGAQVGYELPHSRKQESEADHVGLRYMARAGYNPEAALTFWQRFAKANEAQGGSGPPAFLRDHPVDSKRIEDIRHWLPEAKAQMRGSAGSLTR
ncbi:MAG TPA: M48 family metallopeptidase [Candidatus Binatia bacterium]|nr:M48 family metallopeptidase [Candidatus Binatia bacterium]